MVGRRADGAKKACDVRYYHAPTRRIILHVADVFAEEEISTDPLSRSLGRERRRRTQKHRKREISAQWRVMLECICDEEKTTLGKTNRNSS